MGRRALREQVRPPIPRVGDLIALVKERWKKEGLSTREAATAIGIPHSTFCTVVEKETSMPELPTFYALCSWVGIDMPLAPDAPDATQPEPPAAKLAHADDMYLSGLNHLV